MNGIILDLDETEYHRHPALSSTGARQLLESPARFRYMQDHPQPPKDVFDLGTAVHSKVLGTGWGVTVLDHDDFRTKAAREERDAVRAAGSVPILRADYVNVEAIAEAVLTHPTGRLLLEQAGAAETSVFANDPDTGVDVRARFDFLPDLTTGNPIAVDLKTTGKSASPDGFSKSVANFGYDVQEGHYDDTLWLATGEQIPFVFLVVETAAPHLVGVHQLDVVWRDMGKAKARRARDIFATCTESGEWPGYPAAVDLISPPQWAIYQHEEQYA